MRGAADSALALRAQGLLAAFNGARILSSADVHVAQRLGRLDQERDEWVLLAAALAVRAVREGSVGLRLADAIHTDAEGTDQPDDEPDRDGADSRGPAQLPWPEIGPWTRRLEASRLVAVGTDAPDDRPLRWARGLLYLDRYWRDEQRIRTEVERRLAATFDVDRRAVAASVQEFFPEPEDSRQRLAAAACVLSRLTVLTGGPGTGKTTTVARILAVARSVLGPRLRIALAAPTGKAAARLTEAVRSELGHLDAAVQEPVPAATTVHRLLGSAWGSSTRFRHDEHHRLPHDLVVVDETSMMSLPLIARLLEALRPDARLLLVGDPDQLASVEAGVVLADLVARPAVGHALPRDLSAVVPGDLPTEREARDRLRNGVVRLEKVHRHGGGIAELARAIRTGDADSALVVLRSGGERDLEFVETSGRAPLTSEDILGLRRDATVAGARLVHSARAGDAAAALAALDSHRLLLAHRRGPVGVAHWAGQVEAWVAEASGLESAVAPWYAGRPLLVTANDPATRLWNGDTGVVVDRDGGLVASFGDPANLRDVPLYRLPPVETVYATTVHRGQGSQFAKVTLILPPETSPLLTRELLYTAVTRATDAVRVIGSAEAVRTAVSRHVRRASGLLL